MFKRFSQWRWLWITALVLLLDLVSKNLINHYLGEAPLVLGSFLNLVLVHNTGAAFGFLSQDSGWQTKVFAWIGVVISVLILIWLLMMNPQHRLMPIALCFILGGALGNLYDRALMGSVTDFIDVHYQNWHWPAFNVADMAVSLGTFLLIIGLFRRSL